MLQKKSQFVLVMLLLVAAITRPIWHPQNVHICVCMCVCNCVFIATIHNYRKSFEYDEAHRANKVQSKEEHRMPRGSHDGVGERERVHADQARVCVGEVKESQRKREQRSMCASLLRMRRRVSRCEERPQEQQQYLTQATFGNNNNKKQFCNCYEIVTKRNAAKILLTLVKNKWNNNNTTQ